MEDWRAWFTLRGFAIQIYSQDLEQMNDSVVVINVYNSEDVDGDPIGTLVVYDSDLKEINNA